MVYQKAIELRDKYKPILVGKPMLDVYGKPYKKGDTITDLIVSPIELIGKVFINMWDNNLTNEQALSLFSIEPDDFEVSVISYHVWGAAILYHFKLDKYLELTHSQIEP